MPTRSRELSRSTGWGDNLPSVRLATASAKVAVTLAHTHPARAGPVRERHPCLIDPDAINQLLAATTSRDPARLAPPPRPGRPAPPREVDHHQCAAVAFRYHHHNPRGVPEPSLMVRVA
jgi:hypothetical protein